MMYRGNMYHTSDFKPKKAFGQHFLTDGNIVRKIVQESGVKANEKVWEVGGGQGILTDSLLETGCDVTVFEIDYTLQDYLESKYQERIRLIKRDVLKVDWNTLFPDENIAMVANIPYQITSPLLFRIAEHHAHFSKIVVMIQKEVALRMLAKPSTKDYGILTLKMQYYFDISLLFHVPPTVFTPPPQVDSTVIKLTPRKDKPTISHIENYWKLIETAFQQRRKMLRNNVRHILTEEQYEKLLQTTPIDLTRRGETLNEQEFIALHSCIELL